jgi:mRNA interferase MazF
LRRGELFRVAHPGATDPKRARVFAVVGRQVVIESKFSTVICAPVYSVYDGLASQVPVGPEEGLKKDCSLHCDALVSLPKSRLTHYVGALSASKLPLLDQALKVALSLED